MHKPSFKVLVTKSKLLANGLNSPFRLFWYCDWVTLPKLLRSKAKQIYFVNPVALSQENNSLLESDLCSSNSELDNVLQCNPSDFMWYSVKRRHSTFSWLVSSYVQYLIET